MAKRRAKSLPKYEQMWRKVRKKAPRVPDITSDVISRLDTLSNTTKRLTTAQNKVLSKKMEKKKNGTYSTEEILEAIKVLNEQTKSS